MGRFVFWVLSLVVLVGCSKVLPPVSNEIGLNNQKELTRIQSFAFSSDKKYLALLHNDDKVNIINIENLYMNEFDLYQETQEDKEKEKKKREETVVWQNSNKKNSIKFVTKEKTFEQEASVGFSFEHKGTYETTNVSNKYSDILGIGFDGESKKNSQEKDIESCLFSSNKEVLILQKDNKVKSLNIETERVTNSSYATYQKLLLTHKNNSLNGLINSDGSLSIVDSHNKKIVTIKIFHNPYKGEKIYRFGTKYENNVKDSWLAITPKGYYVGSYDAYQYLDVEKNYEKFYRPDVVRMALQGQSIEENLPSIADLKAPPKIEIIDTKQNQENLKLVVRITPQSGGIGDIRLYHNGTAIALQTKDFTIQHLAKPFTKTYNIKLVDGNNEIKVIAFEQSNSRQSEYATYHVTLTSTHQYRPKLYALVVGIQEFENSKKNLTYTRSDAKLFAQTLAKVRQGLFDQGKIVTLLSKEETTKEHILEAFDQFKEIDNRDMFLFYAGSHGMVDGDIYYLISSNVGSLSSRRLQRDAISRDEIKVAISNIPASKKMIILDTCFAGQYSETSNEKRVATRGLSEEEALNVLSRAVGTNVFSASKSTQESLEGYKEHGLFTYVLVEGLREEADQNHDGYIKTFELADYVDEVVPRISDRKFKHKQFPTINTSGQAFPIGRVQPK